MFLVVFMVRKGNKKNNLRATPPGYYNFQFFPTPLQLLVFDIFQPPTIPHTPPPPTPPTSIRDLAVRRGLSFFPSFCKKVHEPSFQIKVRVNRTFFTLSLIIQGIKIGSYYDKI